MENLAAMSLVREGLSELISEEGDMGELEDALATVRAGLAELAAPEFECALVPLPPTAEIVYPGLEGLERAWRDWSETFASVRGELEETLQSDTHLVLLVRQVAITRHGGVEVTQPSAMVWAFDAGRVTRVELHLDRARALRNAGLDPQSSQE